MPRIEETHTDVLQNLEMGIMDVYRPDKSLLDVDVRDALAALVRYYHAIEEQRVPSVQPLGELAQRVFASVQKFCEWRLGNTPLGDEAPTRESTIPVSTLVECLRRLQKSVQHWNREGGRQGYLKFVSQYMP